MVTEKIKQLQALQAKARELQDSIESERTQELASLPARYGYDSIPAFVKALKQASGAKSKRAGRGKAAKPAAAGKAGKKRTRAKITPEVKAQVKSAVEDGKTGAEIAKALGISLPSVQNIKKELGLVKARGSR